MVIFMFSYKEVDTLINDFVDMWEKNNSRPKNEEDLYECCYDIVDEWISCSGINGYVFSKLEKIYNNK